MAVASLEGALANAAALVAAATAGGGGAVEETTPAGAAEGSAAAVTQRAPGGFPAIVVKEVYAKWVGHYSSAHSILLVGEGDFSFSLALATGFGSGANLVATSLDSYRTLTEDYVSRNKTLKKKYSQAESNLAKLKMTGAVILHEVDAGKMDCHGYLKGKRFNRIVFNFPHAGFSFGMKEDDERFIRKHQEVVKAFFDSASHLLLPYGEIHVSHKTKRPYCNWDLPGLAAESALHLVGQDDFCMADYPGYNNKRGDGDDCDEPFMLGECSTFMFRKRPSHLPPLAPVWQGWQLNDPFNTFGILPGSGFSHYDAAAQPGYVFYPQHNGNMHQDQPLYRWRMLISEFGRHPY